MNAGVEALEAHEERLGPLFQAKAEALDAWLRTTSDDDRNTISRVVELFALSDLLFSTSEKRDQLAEISSALVAIYDGCIAAHAGGSH
jgi:hypothetical protein